MQISSTNYVALTAMITPAIFMTANASLIISTSNRASRESRMNYGIEIRKWKLSISRDLTQSASR